MGLIGPPHFSRSRREEAAALRAALARAVVPRGTGQVGGAASVCSGEPGKVKGALGLVKVGSHKKLTPGLMSPSPTTEFHHLCTQPI